MKQANNNEVDVLLRSLASGRKQLASQSSDGELVTSPHLDADELNSYAEGVAPDPARARYTQHLAECDACRGILVDLTQAAGAANRFEVPEQKVGANFWQKLGEFFSPRVLGFAVPALVLTAVIGISLLALKQRQRPPMVAQSEPAVATPAAAQNNADSKVSSVAQRQETVQNGTRLGVSSESPKEVTASGREKLQADQEALKTDLSGGKAAPPKDSGQPADSASVAESRPYAPEPKAAAPPPAVLNSEKSAELGKEGPAKREDEARGEDDVLRVQSDDVRGPSRSRSNTAQPTSQRGAGIIVGGRGPSGMDKNKKANEIETRTVMGRHFTREGDAWVDTAYESSRSSVRVSRGSDQFRALVADEPGLRTIAEQLNGVVIVVWKNRVYRIQ